MYSRRSWTLSFDIVDNLTEDAHLMMEQQESTTDCIREILMDFIRANGIVKNYLDIPRRNALKDFSVTLRSLENSLARLRKSRREKTLKSSRAIMR